MPLGLGVGIGLDTRGEGGARVNLAAPLLALIAKGTDGFWHGGLASALFQGADETTPARVASDPIGRSNDRSAFLRNAAQSNATFQPQLQFDGAKPVIRTDGTNDRLDTPVIPGAVSHTILLKAKIPGTISATQIALGCRDNTSTRFSVEFDTSGRLSASMGGTSGTTLHGIVDWRGLLGVFAIVQDAAVPRAYLYEQGVEVLNAAYSGAPGTVNTVAIGAHNNAGAPGSFFGGDIYHAVVINGYAATPQEIADASIYLSAN